MKISNLKKLACITAIVLAPSIAFAGGTQSPDKASTGQSNDPNAEMKAGDMGVVGVGQSSKQDTTMVDDATLATNVQNALKADPNTQNLDIKAEVSNGVVTLTGVASAKRWTARATTVARSVKGVKSVKNNMTIGHKSSRGPPQFDGKIEGLPRARGWAGGGLLPAPCWIAHAR